MATNQYLPFGTAGGANVLSPSAYASLAARLSGFTAGTAASQQLNTVWRQASVAAAMLGEFILDYGALDALDDGSVDNLENGFVRTLQKQPWLFGTAAGTVNALTATLAPAPLSLTAGMRILLDVPSTNTSATVTLNVNGLGAKNVYRRNSASLAIGDVKPGINEFIYDGTNFRLSSPAFVASTISSNGFIDLPGGITVQWGQSTTSGGFSAITFPKAFSAVPYAVFATDRAAGSWTTSNASFIGADLVGATNVACGFQSVTWQGSGTGFVRTTVAFCWMAVGPT